jgi:hypothetical protein
MTKHKKVEASPVENAGAENLAECEDQNTCAGFAAGLPLRSDLKLLRIEDITLELLRCIGLMLGTGDCNYWNCAVSHAEKQLGLLEGPVLVARVTSLLRAIRAERHGSFSFLSVGCQHICDDEFAVMTIIKAARQGNFETLREVARQFARSSTIDRIDLAARAVAGEQSRHATMPEQYTTITAADGTAVPTLH